MKSYFSNIFGDLSISSPNRNSNNVDMNDITETDNTGNLSNITYNMSELRMNDSDGEYKRRLDEVDAVDAVDNNDINQISAHSNHSFHINNIDIETDITSKMIGFVPVYINKEDDDNNDNSRILYELVTTHFLFKNSFTIDIYDKNRIWDELGNVTFSDIENICDICMTLFEITPNDMMDLQKIEIVPELDIILVRINRKKDIFENQVHVAPSQKYELVWHTFCEFIGVDSGQIDTTLGHFQTQIELNFVNQELNFNIPLLQLYKPFM